MRRAQWTGFGAAAWLILGTCLVVLAPSAAAGPVVNFSRTFVGFSFVPPLAHIVQPVFVTNTGDASLNISAISLTGINSADFTLGGDMCRPDCAPGRRGPVQNRHRVGGNFNAPPVTSAMQVGHVTMSFSDCATAQFDYTFTDGSNRSGTVPLTRLTPNVLCATADSTTGPSDFGLSGNWFDQAKSGQGLVFEVNPVARIVFFAWYTYAVGGQSQGAAGQRWYTGQATYAPGTRTIPVLLYETTGGLLNSATPAPTTAQVGNGTLTFSSCTAARLAYAFTGGSNTGESGSIDLVRVGPVPASCAF